MAIIDTGVDPTHPELQGQFWVNSDDIPRNRIDDDHNGFVDDTLGYDLSGNRITFFTPVGDNDPTDTVGHGTHIAGIIAAKENGVGIAGVAPNAAIMPLKIYPNAFTSLGAAAIVYAVVNGADVVSISWGSPFVSGVLRDALLFARENNVFIAIAAGNSGSNDRFFPAGYDSSFVVGASNSDGEVTTFSTFGNHIDIVAPGLDILSLRAKGTDMYAAAGEPEIRIIDSLYYLSDGTSMSTPIVAAAAARILALHPNMTIQDIEASLLLSADDMIDPYGIGDEFPGKDSISGYGALNIAQGVNLAGTGGLFLFEPESSRRYTADFTVKAVSLQGYTGAWTLYRAFGYSKEPMVEVAAGSSVPTDSILFTQTGTDIQGAVTFRLVDALGREHEKTCIYAPVQRLEITSPTRGQDVQYNIPIRGWAGGPGFDSLVLLYQRPIGAQLRLLKTTGEYFDSLLFPWTVSGADTGMFKITLHGYFGATRLTDTLSVHVTSAFALGWPQSFLSQGGISPVVADLANDGSKEVILATTTGLYAWEQTAVGSRLLVGYPVMVGDSDMQGIPAIYDIDKDGVKDIICTNKDGLHAFKYDGTYVEGFPRYCYTGQIPYGFGYPIPVITKLNAGEDSVIIFLNKRGEINAFRFDGSPYFYSLKGLYSSLDPRISEFYSYGGFTWPCVSTADLNGDGTIEVISSYESGAPPYTGISLLEGRTGRIAWGMESALVLSQPVIHGTVLADITGDGLADIITAGTDTSNTPHVWVKTEGRIDAPGWPVTMPNTENWVATYPAVSDLDMDGSLEILVSFFDFDVGSIYAFRSNGQPYVSKPGRPTAELFFVEATLGTPVIADVVGDEHPEIVVRTGYVLPGTGNEKLYVVDYQGNVVPGYPIITPTSTSTVFSSQFAPLVDDIDSDGLVEIALVGDGNSLFVWNMTTSSRNGQNVGRLFFDNCNSGVYPVNGQFPVFHGGR